jgi:hypothetical protein
MPPKQINPHYTEGCAELQATLAAPDTDESYKFIWFNDPTLTRKFGLVVRHEITGRLVSSDMMMHGDARKKWLELISLGFVRVR